MDNERRDGSGEGSESKLEEQDSGKSQVGGKAKQKMTRRRAERGKEKETRPTIDTTTAGR